jgi:hypothetical protein
MNYEYHEAANLFRLMNTEEFSRLKASIEEHGLKDAIVLCDGKILDGRNRYRACLELQVSPHFADWDGSYGSPTLYSVNKNLNHRHLSASERAAVVSDMMPMLSAEARKRMEATQAKPGEKVGAKALIDLSEPTPPAPRSIDIAAAVVGVSPATAWRANKVKEVDTEAFDRIKSGESTVNAEYYRVVKKVEPVERKKPVMPLSGQKFDTDAAAAGRRLAEFMGVMQATVQGLKKLRPAYVIAGCGDRELAAYLKSMRQMASELRQVAKTIEGQESNDELQNENDND